MSSQRYAGVDGNQCQKLAEIIRAPELRLNFRVKFKYSTAAVKRSN